MKIAVRAGHNLRAKGAIGIIDETIENRKVCSYLIKYLNLTSHKVIDVTQEDVDSNRDLILGVQKAEENKADLFVSIHFDKAYNKYDGALGTGTWIYKRGGNAEVYARRIVDNLSRGTGFKNRGVRENSKLYELRKTSMPAVLVEVCFCEATYDVKIYKEKGPEIIGKLIAEAINGEKIIDDYKDLVNTKPLKKEEFISLSNAKALVDLDPRDKPSNTYCDLGEIYKGERIKVLQEICDKEEYLPIVYWKDFNNEESKRVWIKSIKKYLNMDTNGQVFNVKTKLYARYSKDKESLNMGYVENGERLYVHKREGDYFLCTYSGRKGYKTAYFTAKYIKLD